MAFSDRCSHRIVRRSPAWEANRRAARARRWRRRGRRAQVAAVATILGLLLVVTFIANYLSTTLPNQMSVNDLNHEIQVENQAGHLQALLQSLAKSGAVGAPALQPVTLGSAAAPPFAGSDGGVLSQIAPYGSSAAPQVVTNLSLVSTHYAPPTGWVAGGSYNTAGCTQTPASPANATSISCLGSGKGQVSYNFTGSASFSVSGNGGAAFQVNFSSNHSRVVVSQTGQGGGFENVQVVGGYDSVFVTGTGQTVQTVILVGNYNTLTLNASTSTSRVFVIGNHDSVTVNDAAANSTKVLVVGWGSYDSFSPGKGGVYSVYYNGFNTQAPTSPICPYDNLAVTDSVKAPPSGYQGSYSVTYNLTGGLPPAAPSPWKTFPTSSAPAPSTACPFFPLSSIGGQNVHSATLRVSLRNTYAPAAEVAFDEGAIVYAQPGSYPVMVDGPVVSYSPHTATVWVPSFESNLTSVAGIGTAMLSLRLVSVTTLALPSGSWAVNPAVPLRLVYTTPYAHAWESYFATNPVTAPYVSCAPATSVACTGPYQPNGPFGTVTLSLPVSTLTIQFAVYSLTVG